MTQRALLCLGAAFLLLVHPIIDLVGGQSMVRYHSAVSLAPLVGALCLAPLALTAFALGFIVLTEKLGAWKWLRIAVAAWLPLLLARRIGLLSGHLLPGWLVQLCFVVFIAALLYLARRHAAAFAGLMRAGSLAMACLGASTLLLGVQMAQIARWRPAQPVAAQAATLPVHAASHARVVWIVLDELSYDQAFAHRAAGLALPSLDALANQSIRYSDVQPVGDKTDRVMPSLLLGQQVEDIDYTRGNRFLIEFADARRWQSFNAAQTPFALAKQRGWNTGVVGWYNPYCSLLAPYLDRCFWANEDMDKPAWNLEPGQSAWSGAWTGLEATVGVRASKNAILTETARARLHLRSAQQTHDEAVALASDDGIDLMLLHLPVPHFPNVYDRRTGQYSLGHHSYADNLALADRSLGELMAILERSPRWANTTLVLCGDHSWRDTWWRPTPFWTAEDERISHGGVFDPRPVLLVHMPGQSAPLVNPAVTSLLEVRRILVDTVTEGTVPTTRSTLQAEAVDAKQGMMSGKSPVR